MVKKRGLLKLLAGMCLALVLIAISVLPACAPKAPAEAPAPAPAAPELEVLNWRMPSLLPGGLGYWTHQYFAQLVKEMSDGRVNIEVYPAGSLMPNTEIWESMRKGLVEISVNTMGFEIGTVGPALYVEGYPVGAFESWFETYDFFYEFGFIELVRELYADKAPWVYYIGPNISGPWNTWSNVKITKLEDYKGLRFRDVGFTAVVHEALGVKTMPLGNEEVYTAVATGVVDGARWGGIPFVYDNGLHEVVKYLIMPTLLAAPSNHFVIRTDAWAKLTDAEKKIMDVAARLSSVMYKEQDFNRSAALWTEMTEVYGMEESWLEPEEQVKLRAIIAEVYQTEIVEKDPVWGPRTVGMLKAFLAGLGRPMD